VTSIPDFAVEVVAISASGVLAPGPMFLANLLYGSRQSTGSGLKMACGHTVVEFPLIMLLAAGLFVSVAFADKYAGPIGIIGGIAILGFAGVQVATVSFRKNLTRPIIESRKGPFLAGIAFSALNPFFLIWWFTIGLKLVADSAAFEPIPGALILFGLHIWMDYAWLAATAYLASRGSSILRSNYYRILLIVLSGVLAYYGVFFILTSI
jgi:threonine/homoserine/homoserine lactone efflux protein